MSERIFTKGREFVLKRSKLLGIKKGIEQILENDTEKHFRLHDNSDFVYITQVKEKGITLTRIQIEPFQTNAESQSLTITTNKLGYRAGHITEQTEDGSTIPEKVAKYDDLGRFWDVLSKLKEAVPVNQFNRTVDEHKKDRENASAIRTELKRLLAESEEVNACSDSYNFRISRNKSQNYKFHLIPLITVRQGEENKITVQAFILNSETDEDQRLQFISLDIFERKDGSRRGDNKGEERIYYKVVDEDTTQAILSQMRVARRIRQK